MTTDQVQTTPDPWGPSRLLTETETARDTYRDLFYETRAERDRYKAVLREIESWQKNPDWKHEPCACPTIAREALQQEQA